MTEKRHSQGSSGYYKRKLLGNCIIHACAQPVCVCPYFEYPRCITTGEHILYPVTGPTGALCQLPDYINPEDEIK